MTHNAALSDERMARIDRYHQALRDQLAERARLAAAPTQAPTLKPVYRQGVFGDWEWLLANPDHCVLTRWLNRSLLLEHQYGAGMRLRTDHWRGGLDGVRAIDPTREPVDGGRNKDLTDGQLDARNDFHAALRSLNRMSARLVVDVAVLDRDAGEIEADHRWRKGYGMCRIREALDDLARHYGYLGGPA